MFGFKDRLRYGWLFFSTPTNVVHTKECTKRNGTSSCGRATNLISIIKGVKSSKTLSNITNTKILCVV